MVEHQILFSAPMVRAILEGRKTQTRRVVSLPRNMEPLNEEGDFEIDDAFDDRGRRMDWPYAASKKTGCMTAIECPYGSPGDTLWVRETWAHERQFDHLKPSDIPASARSSERCLYGDGIVSGWHKKRSARFMPRWASRLTLRIASVRVERLQDISEADIVAEGLTVDVASKLTGIPWSSLPTLHDGWSAAWDTINGKRAPWVSNPWVWVVEFERVKENA